MSIEQNKAIVERLKEEIWNLGNLEVAYELIDADLVNHDPDRLDVQNREQFIGFVREIREAFPDFKVRLLDVTAEGEKVVARWEIEGTHKGTFQNIPPTGKSIKSLGMTEYRLFGGKIVEIWWSRDTLGILHQLGVIPEMAHA